MRHISTDTQKAVIVNSKDSTQFVVKKYRKNFVVHFVVKFGVLEFARDFTRKYAIRRKKNAENTFSVHFVVRFSALDFFFLNLRVI